MSADRYELRADHTDWLDVRDPQGYRNTINQPGAVALIRQQARDIAELKAEARILGYRAKTLDMLALRILGDEESEDFVKDELDHLQQPSDWLPFESPAYVVAQCIDERDQLRADLAAAVALTAARDETIAELELRLRISRQSNKELRESAERAEARLAVIDNAPAVATVVDIGDECGPNPNVTFYSYQLPPTGTELIARPAKD